MQNARAMSRKYPGMSAPVFGGDPKRSRHVWSQKSLGFGVALWDLVNCELTRHGFQWTFVIFKYFLDFFDSQNEQKIFFHMFDRLYLGDDLKCEDDQTL